MINDTLPEDSRSEERYFNYPGPYMARVVSHIDAKYMGSLQVELINDVGRDEPGITGSVITVRYLSPFAGQTSITFTNETPNDYDSTQKAYGMWMVPPDVGTIVMVMFAYGNAAKGYWIGCAPDEYVNFMVPGMAATSTTTETGSDERKVVGEYNKKANKTLTQPDVTQLPKPVHPFHTILTTQGLNKDDTRGITSSSARRELPSTVFGISTPGPVDRKPNAPTGQIGKKESRIQSAFVSRLGGTTFVMDDGDESFIRKTPASEGPPDYVSVENGESGGQPDIPHNELVRIRTRTGHQILLHNSEDLIYIGNAAGTTWIELTSMGKIDIYAQDSVSIHTEKDINIKADQDINMDAGRNVNIRSGRNHNVEVGSVHSLIVGADQKISVAGTKHESIGANRNTSVTGASSEAVGKAFNLQTGSNVKVTSGADIALLSSGGNKFTSGTSTSINAASNINLTSGAKINLNGPLAEAATAASITNAVQPDALAIVVARTPMHEPWDGHENLHGQDPTKYTTSTDTFRKISK